MADPRLCSIPDCNKPFYGLGYCNLHYGRFRRHGDALGGRARNGEPERFFREEVLPYDGQECLTWPYSRNPGGYAIMRQGGFTRLVTRLVCDEEFGPPPEENMVAAHTCNNGHLGCVAKSHLRWKTYLENLQDSRAAGTFVEGSKHPQAKLTEADVIEIRDLIGILTNKQIGARFGVNWRTISKIKHGQRWKSLPEPRGAR